MNKATKIKKFLAAHYGIRAKKIAPVRQGVINENFVVSDARGGRHLFKIYNLKKARLQSPRDVEFTLAILRELEKRKFPAPRIIPTETGEGYALFYGRPSALFWYIGGGNISEKNLDARVLYKIGILEGKLHRLLQNFEVPPARRDTWEPRDLRKYLKEETPRICQKFPGAGERIAACVAAEFNSLSLPLNLPRGITHQDIKPENIIMDKQGNISVVDFDNAYYGVLLYDLMTTAIWSCFPNRRFDEKRFYALLKGYEKERLLTSLERKHLGEALRFRLLREAFAWPMRFSTPQAIAASERFIGAYKQLPALL